MKKKNNYLFRNPIGFPKMIKNFNPEPKRYKKGKP
jgi:hypothetical protein